jgi:integrase-like protein
MDIQEVLTAPRSPWQNAYVERFIGFARRECLDHFIVFNAAALQRLMKLYCAYYDQSRTHLSLNKDAPIPRPIAAPVDGRVVAIPQVGGLHHGTNGWQPDPSCPLPDANTNYRAWKQATIATASLMTARDASNETGAGPCLIDRTRL